MKKLLFGLTLMISVSSFADGDKADTIAISIDGESCILKKGDEIFTSVKNNNYGVTIGRSVAGDNFTLRVGNVSSGAFSTILFMDDIPMPHHILSFQAGNLMSFKAQDKVRVGIYNLSNPESSLLRGVYGNAPTCKSNFAK